MDHDSSPSPHPTTSHSMRSCCTSTPAVSNKTPVGTSAPYSSARSSSPSTSAFSFSRSHVSPSMVLTKTFSVSTLLSALIQRSASSFHDNQTEYSALRANPAMPLNGFDARHSPRSNISVLSWFSISQPLTHTYDTEMT